MTFDLLEQLRQFINNSCSDKEPWQLIVGTFASTCIAGLILRLLSSEESLSNSTKRILFKLVRNVPHVRRKIQAELEKTKLMLEFDIHKCDEKKTFHETLPENGLSHEEVLDLAIRYENMGNFNYKGGMVSGAVYTHDDENLNALCAKVYGLYCYSNPLHADVFPGCRKMEAEIVRMTCSLFSGDENTCGTVTSGGTESLILACYAYRNLAKEKRIKNPEILLPVTAHAAFDKAASMFNIRLVKVPLNDDFTLNLMEMKNRINKNTCLLVASCPNFPHGIIDPVEAIAKLGRKHNIPVHVDACLGGFLVCFMEECGFDLKPFDFRVPGVTSISADTHKYGYAPKGTSVVMYANNSYLHHQYFCQPDWPGGLYASPTIAGSRSGANIAVCWATLLNIGKEAYIRRTRKIIETTRYITDMLHKIEGIHVIGEPEISVVAFTSYVFDIYVFFERMTKLGWNLNALQFPSAVHLCVTGKHVKRRTIADKFLADVESTAKNLIDNPVRSPKGMAAMYGTSQKIPDRSLVSEMAFLYLDACYSTKVPEPVDHED